MLIMELLESNFHTYELGFFIILTMYYVYYLQFKIFIGENIRTKCQGQTVAKMVKCHTEIYLEKMRMLNV